MNSTLEYHRDQYKLSEEDTYATSDDFQRLFASEMADLFRLSLRLTADPERAESCLIRAMRECIANSTVSKRWSLIWTRRTVIRNAIRLVLGIENAVPHDVCCEVNFHFQPNEYRVEAMGNSLSILALPDLDRLVFVICVLERYSIMDCALLLARPPRVVNDARVRAIKQVISTENRNRPEIITTSPYSGCGNQLGEFDDSCGSLLE